jgi:hypothetical protein
LSTHTFITFLIDASTTVNKIIIKKTLFLFFTALLFAQSASATETPTIGEEEHDYQKVFLRQSSVLLKQGGFRLDADVTYERNQQQLDWGNYYITRQLSCTTTLSYGYSKEVEVVISSPLIWKLNTTRIAQSDNTERCSGIGDPNIGIKYLLHAESELPEVIGSVTVTIPSAQSPYENTIGFGSGVSMVSTGLTFIKSTDPAVVFSRLSINHPFAKTVAGYTLQPGWSMDYTVGIGLSFNDRLTLSESFSGSYQNKGKSNHPNASNLSSEPMVVRSDFTYFINKDFTITPSVSLGLNSDAPNTAVGFGLSRTF